jgi:hypothetical protein
LKLSIVMCASNESYGGNFLGRMQQCVNTIFEGAAKHGLDGELVVVEWGPPLDRPTLDKAINWTGASIPTRIIRVPKTLVEAIPNPHQVKFFEPWAKNVGIRRAKGDWVLTTNADILFSDAMMDVLAGGYFNPKFFFRANQRNMCEGPANVPRRKINTSTRQPGGWYWTWTPAPKGIEERVYTICYANGNYQPYEPREGHSKTGVPYRPDMLHFNAAGAFIMMTKKNYIKIGGWPETDYWVSVDGKVVALAADAGLTQATLQEPIYHLDHPRAATDSPGSWYPECDDAHPNAIANTKADWGFANEKFEEVIVRD